MILGLKLSSVTYTYVRSWGFTSHFRSKLASLTWGEISDQNVPLQWLYYGLTEGSRSFWASPVTSPTPLGSSIARLCPSSKRQQSCARGVSDANRLAQRLLIFYPCVWICAKRSLWQFRLLALTRLWKYKSPHCLTGTVCTLSLERKSTKSQNCFRHCCYTYMVRPVLVVILWNTFEIWYLPT